MESAEHLPTVDRLPPLALVSVEQVVVSADGSGENLSRRSHFDTALLADGSVDSGLAAATRSSVSVDQVAVSADGSGESWSWIMLSKHENSMISFGRRGSEDEEDDRNISPVTHAKEK